MGTDGVSDKYSIASRFVGISTYSNPHVFSHKMWNIGSHWSGAFRGCDRSVSKSKSQDRGLRFFCLYISNRIEDSASKRIPYWFYRGVKGIGDIVDRPAKILSTSQYIHSDMRRACRFASFGDSLRIIRLLGLLHVLSSPFKFTHTTLWSLSRHFVSRFYSTLSNVPGPNPPPNSTIRHLPPYPSTRIPPQDLIRNSAEALLKFLQRFSVCQDSSLV